MKLMHTAPHRFLNVNPISRTSLHGKQASNTGEFPQSSLGLKENLKEIYDFAELNNRMINSRQMSDQLNSLQWQVSSLQQKVASYDRSLNDLLSRNWLLPRRSIQGISGYLCEKCKSFSLKPIFDIGHDMTMQSRHRCNEPEYKRNYLIYPIPRNIQNTEIWAGNILAGCVSSYTFIGKNLIATDLTSSFNDIKHQLNSEIAYQILGIPDRFYLYSLKSNAKMDWMDKAIENLDKKIPLSDLQIIDFVTRIMSTYAIFEILSGTTVRQISLILTN